MNVDVDCELCGHRFDVDKSLVGGHTNCPKCKKATPVPGLRDPIWRLWQLVVGTVVCVMSYSVYEGYGTETAVGVFFGGLGLCWLISRGF